MAEAGGEDGKYSAPRVRATTMTYGKKHSFVFSTGAGDEKGNVSSPTAAMGATAAAAAANEVRRYACAHSRPSRGIGATWP